MPGFTRAVPVIGSAIALALFPQSAHAQYLDPGAGSIIVQAVIAATIGAAAAVKLYWSRISAFIAQRRNKDTGRS
jgi:hypothetical protein